MAGYLTPVAHGGKRFELKLTNGEVREKFEELVSDWFITSPDSALE